MLLAHQLHAAGIETIVLEQRSRDYVEGRVRAGVLEQSTVEMLVALGLGERAKSQGIFHEGVHVAFDGDLLRIDFAALTDGGGVTVYGQQEVMHDLFEGAKARGVRVEFECAGVQLHDLYGSPRVTWTQDGQAHSIDCDFIAGCDGQHGAARASLPAGAMMTFERTYPFGWLGILAETPPVADELIYASHERGFALASMRSPTRSRYYLQCRSEADIAEWSDDRFWDELAERLGPEASANLVRAPSFEKSIAPLRSVVSEPMRFGSLFLAGDAAHIVPPTGAKGLNLAASDVRLLAQALIRRYAEKDAGALDEYGPAALARVWRAVRFSWWFTSLMHRFPDSTAFDRRIQRAEFDQLASSRAAQRMFAESYIGGSKSGPS